MAFDQHFGPLLSMKYFMTSGSMVAVWSVIWSSSMKYFMTSGSMGAVWSVIWLILVADSPEEAKRISEKERLYIHNCLSGQTADHAKHVS